jgi:hypothetical protein
MEAVIHRAICRILHRIDNAVAGTIYQSGAEQAEFVSLKDLTSAFSSLVN